MILIFAATVSKCEVILSEMIIGDSWIALRVWGNVSG